MSTNYSTDEEGTNEDSPAHSLCCYKNSTPCAECRTTAILKQEIHRMQYSLVCLFEQHRASLQKMNNVHDPLVSRLPVEVVSRIFSTFVPVDVDKCYGPICPEGVEEVPITPLLLGAVCRTWRSIAWSTPKLWTSISLSVYEYYDGLGDVVREWLGRSGKLPLCIRLYTSPICTRDIYGRYRKPPDADQPYVAELIDAISACSERWFYLDVHVPKSFMERLQSGTRQLPMLNTLNLQVVIDCIPKSPKFEYTDKINFGEISNLRRIRALNPDFHQIPFSWQNLTHVEASTFTVEICMELLYMAPFLTHLVIQEMKHAPYYEYYPIIRHSNLVSLEIMGYRLEKILSTLNLPALVHFGAEMTGHDHSNNISIKALLDRSSCSLKGFHFKFPFLRANGGAKNFQRMVSMPLPLSVKMLEFSCRYSQPYQDSPRHETDDLEDIVHNFPQNLKHLRIRAKFYSWNCLLDLSGQPDCFPLACPKDMNSISTLSRTKPLQPSTLQIQPEDLNRLLDIKVLQALQAVIESNFDVEPSEELKLSPSFTQFLRGSLYRYKYSVDPANPESHSHSAWCL